MLLLLSGLTPDGVIYRYSQVSRYYAWENKKKNKKKYKNGTKIKTKENRNKKLSTDQIGDLFLSA